MVRSNASTYADPEREREDFWFGLLLDAAHVVPLIILVLRFLGPCEVGAEAKPLDAGVLLHISRDKVVYLSQGTVYPPRNARHWHLSPVVSRPMLTFFVVHHSPPLLGGSLLFLLFFLLSFVVKMSGD